MGRKLIIIIIASLAFGLGVIGFSAFEAQVINVTATIKTRSRSILCSLILARFIRKKRMNKALTLV